ncbi:MAG: DNA polymerase III subunit alpha [Hahellaceae bacterium]|nr:DNA polymerase III subunit alpha [Hahellaceae bacterium]MCP5213176.1 DNA polymerase III subunit alpha [Hahellaceae bacterium]
MTKPFVHLRVHTEFSLVDGIVRIKPLLKTVAEQKMPALAITDQSNMCSLVKFYKGAMGAGVKPVIGVDIWVENLDEEKDPHRLTLLAMNEQGYANITEIVSLGFTQGQKLGRAVIRHEWIERLSEGVIALSGAKFGDVGKAIVSGRQDIARNRLDYWMRVFPDRFYIELQRTSRTNDEECVHGSVALALASNCPVVATNDVHFLSKKDFDAHEARVCIRDGKTIEDPRRERRFSDQQYFKTAEEMYELFSDIPEALENTVEIAKRCNVEVRLGKYFLPEYPIPDGMTMDEFFHKVSYDGLEDRLKVILKPDDPDRDVKRQSYMDRIKFELDIICQMGFPGYFLIVMDFIQWAKDNGVPVGPGRGSGAGSLVAYALLITDIDPIEYDLLFERFLNPERVSMPDFDVDFCMEGRDRVIDYVAENYGREAVSQIITFGTMAAKAVVRDVARVQGRPYSLGDRLSKLIPFEVGMTLSKAYEVEDQLRDYLAQDEEANEVWEMAVKLEGITRNVGKHAGGVVIAPTKLIDFAPLYCDEEGGSLVTQFDKGDVEEAGLVKFDFLGLRTLTIIKWALEMINPRRLAKGQELLDISAIPLDDQASFRMLKRAETTAVFQLESRGMKDLIRKLQPDNIEDMIALVALFRPGPLESGMVDDFINRKHGRAEVAFPHPDYQHMSLKPVLETTYGVIVYQEQVMQIAQTLAGYTLGGADMLRRAMGKKKPEEMAKQRQVFAEGAATQGVDPDLAMKIFDLVEKFAGYGFNKSHSAAYAIVSYQTLWLKAHYPAEFMAAVLTADMQNTDKVVTLIEECRKMKLELVLPDVNTSEFTFTVDEGGRIVYGLGAIKGLGEGPVSSIQEARKEGKFTNFFDFCARVDARKVNKRALEALIRSGALDSIGPGRARLMASIEEAVQRADQNNRNTNAGMDDLFGEVVPEAGNDQDLYASSIGVREWSDKDRLNGEKDTLGLYLTGHPFDEYEAEIRQFASTAIVDLKPKKDSQTIAGLVVSSRTMKNKKGDTMAFLVLDDRSGRIEVALFSDVYVQHRDVLQKDAILIIEGEVGEDRHNGGIKLTARKCYDITAARLQNAKGLVLKLDAADLKNGFIQELHDTLAPYKEADSCPVFINYARTDARSMLQLGEGWRVLPADDLVQGLKYMLGGKNVALKYH